MTRGEWTEPALEVQNQMMIDLDVTLSPSGHHRYFDDPATIGRIDTVSRLGVQIDSLVQLHPERGISGG